MEQTMTKSRWSVRDMAYIAVFVAVMAVCSWISIPTAIPFTLQTMGLFMAVGLLGGKRGTIVVIAFILLAAVGAPVLAGFSGGLSALLGVTGGYIMGFLFSALLMWAMEKLWGNSLPVLGVSMVLGMVTYYIFGTAWFMVVYTRTTGAITLSAALMGCVVPYILPDLVKTALALTITARLRPYVK